jgi:hypothetical protein
MTSLALANSGDNANIVQGCCGEEGVGGGTGGAGGGTSGTDATTGSPGTTDGWTATATDADRCFSANILAAAIIGAIKGHAYGIWILSWVVFFIWDGFLMLSISVDFFNLHKGTIF